jgi:hypothetical protein
MKSKTRTTRTITLTHICISKATYMYTIIERYKQTKQRHKSVCQTKKKQGECVHDYNRISKPAQQYVLYKNAYEATRAKQKYICIHVILKTKIYVYT